MLEVNGLSGGYTRTSVVRAIELAAGANEVVGILGRNGTGKTTLMKAIMGLLPWSDGSIVLDGKEISRLPTHKRARAGIAYVPQGRGIFPEATLEENLRYGLLLADRSMKDGLPARVFEMFPWMDERLGQFAGTLSGGEQQMLAIARVLVGEPKVLLLDEPTEGLAPAIVESLRDSIRGIAAAGEHAIVLVEQNLRFVLTLASRGYVLEKGQIAAQGDTQELQREEVVARHLSI
jgi:urea ABC transporter ATP-binding protein UrtE